MKKKTTLDELMTVSRQTQPQRHTIVLYLHPKVVRMTAIILDLVSLHGP